MQKTLFKELAQKHQAALREELVKDIYRRCRVAIFATLIALMILRVILHDIFYPGTALYVTFYALVIVTLARLVLAWYGWYTQDVCISADLYFRSFLAGSFLSGIAFACVNIFSYPTLSLSEVGFLIVFQTGIMSSALVSLGSSRLNFTFFVLPNILSLGILSAIDSRSWDAWILFLLICAYTVTLIMMVHHQFASRSEAVLMSLELKEMALSDHLTKLPNRRFLTTFLDKEVETILRSWKEDPRDLAPAEGQNICLFMLDIDHFKRVNDIYGHAAGDTVLKQIAQIMKEGARKSDIVVRWGGEEFVIAERDVKRAKARQIARRIKDNIQNHTFILPSGETTKITCSIGYSLFPFSTERPDIMNWEQVLSLADAGTYEAKRAGRDRIVFVAPGTNLMKNVKIDVEKILSDFRLALRQQLVQVTIVS